MEKTELETLKKNFESLKEKIGRYYYGEIRIKEALAENKKLVDLFKNCPKETRTEFLYSLLKNRMKELAQHVASIVTSDEEVEHYYYITKETEKLFNELEATHKQIIKENENNTYTEIEEKIREIYQNNEIVWKFYTQLDGYDDKLLQLETLLKKYNIHPPAILDILGIIQDERKGMCSELNTLNIAMHCNLKSLNLDQLLKVIKIILKIRKRRQQEEIKNEKKY